MKLLFEIVAVLINLRVCTRATTILLSRCTFHKGLTLCRPVGVACIRTIRTW